MAGKYLDPKADLTFKLVFGEHRDLAMSLLAYERFWMAINDEEAHIETKYLEGIEEGLAKGRTEERLANARSLKENGVPLDIIAKSLSQRLFQGFCHYPF